MVLACFSYRHDAHLVPDLLKNLDPIVHGWVSLNDRGSISWRSSEPERRRALLRAARRHGAEWLLVVDPDERFEDAFAARLPELTRSPERPIWTVDLLEMFTPTQYRIDGPWRDRVRKRLFPIAPDIRVPADALHGDPFTYDHPRRVLHSGVACCHLRMIAPARRTLRRDHYALADPARRHQSLGYDYLDIEAGMKLADLPDEKRFSPPHQDDGGLWAAPLPAGAQVGADPLDRRLNAIQRCRNTAGLDLAAEIARRAAADFPAQPDLPFLHAALLLEAGRPAEAEAAAALTAAPPQIEGDALAALVLQSRARRELGDDTGAQTLAAQALTLAPDSRLAQQAFGAARVGSEAQTGSNALWRRWVDGEATVVEGAEVARDAEICVIVIGFRAQPGLKGAVASILDQSPAAEVVVVNSGGGDIRGLLADHLPHVRLVELEEPHLVGAARNVGIDASRAPVVAFLAGDCLATPTWIADRLALHRQGAAAVPSRIMPADADSLVSWVASACNRGARWPAQPRMAAPGYGLSYARRLFDTIGRFPIGVGGGEDAYLNDKVCRRFGVRLDADVSTLHRDPRSTRDLRSDARARARQRTLRTARWRDPATDVDRRLEQERAGLQRRARFALTTLFADAPEMRPMIERLILVSVGAAQQGTRDALAMLRQIQRLSAEAGGLAKAEPDRALERLNRLIGLDPEHASHRLDAAMILARLTRWDEAMEMARGGLRVAPWDIRFVKILCEGLTALGRLDAAADTAEDAALACPDSLDHWALAFQQARRAGSPIRALACARFGFLAAPTAPRSARMMAQAYGAVRRPREVEASRALLELLEPSAAPQPTL